MDLSYGDKYLATIINFFDRDVKNRNQIYFYHTDKLVHDDMNTIFDPQFCLAVDDGVKMEQVRFGLKENEVFVSKNDCIVYKYDLNNIISGKNAQSSTHNVSPHLETIHSMTFSPKYEFLMINCDKGIALLNPDDLSVFRIIRTKFPVQCSKVSPLIYNSVNPRFHLIFGGGVASRD